MKKLNLSAGYIWHSQPAKSNEICVFTRTFFVETVPQKATAFIAAETRYYLWVNGVQAVFEGGLFRESVPGSGWADCIDLAPYLTKGENRIVLWVYYFGNGGRNNTRLPCAGLLFECPSLELYSDSHFLCRKHPAFYTPGDPKPSYLYGGDNLGYDARLDSDPQFQNTEGFEPAVFVDRSVFGDLYERPIPQTRVETELISLELRYQDGIYQADLPYAMMMLPIIAVTAQGGEKIYICTDRYETPGGPGDETNRYRGHRIEFICKAGENHFESLIPLFGEKILIQATPSVQIQSVGCRNTGYDADIVGSFHSSEPLLDRLVCKAARTLYVCMRDNFMDCPDRERGQWIGDVSVQVPQAVFLLDSRAMLLVKKAIHDFITLRKGDVLVGNVPGENFSELPAQSLAAISEWGMLAQYWKYTGDIESLQIAFEPAVQYLKLWQLGEDGLLIQRPGNWQWYDHLQNCDGSVIENAWYLSALKFLRKCADILNNHTADSFLDERIYSISEGFEKQYWKGSFYSSDGHLVDDRANALAVLSGVCPKERYPLIRTILLSVFNCTVYMENFVLTALCEMGYIVDARNRMLSRYYPLAVNDNSTLWEDFFILGTKNHAWSGAPATIAFQYFMGIDIDVHSKRFAINPCWDVLQYMNCEIPYQGKILRIKADSRTKRVDVLECIHTKSKIK